MKTKMATGLSLPTLEATSQIAQLLADILGPGDVLLLKGPLGAGKTTFAQFLIQHVTSFGTAVPSPTFPLVNPYETSKGSLWHVDLYRLTPGEVPSLGLEEQWETGITVIEWPERLPYLPQDPLWITFVVAEEGENQESQSRHISFEGSSLWYKRLSVLLNVMNSGTRS